MIIKMIIKMIKIIVHNNDGDDGFNDVMYHSGWVLQEIHLKVHAIPTISSMVC